MLYRFLVPIFLVIWPALVEAQELILNGNFEAGNASKPNLWASYQSGGVTPPQLVESYLQSGGMGNSKCIETGHSYELFSRHMFGDSSYARWRQESGAVININAHGFYRFSVWYKTTNMQPGQVNIELEMFNDSNFITNFIYCFGPAADWTQIVFYFRPIRASDRGFEQVDANRLRVQLGVVSSLGTARWDDASLVAVDEATFNANAPLQTFVPEPLGVRRLRSPSLQARGVWSIQKDSRNVAWFVSPDGFPTWLRAVQNIPFEGVLNPELFHNLNPIYKQPDNSTNNLYEWDSMERLWGLGFNSNSLRSQEESDLHHNGYAHITREFLVNPGESTPVGTFNTAWLLRDKDGDYDRVNKPMPDPWNNNFRTWRRNLIRNRLDSYGPYFASNGSPYRDFLGYFTDNEMGVEHLDLFIWSTDAQAHFIAYCRELYANNISALNAAWTSQYETFNFASFDEIPTRKGDIVRHHLDDPLWPVLNRFIIEMLKELYRVNCDPIRQYEVEKLGDANGDGIAEEKHLIGTNRLEFSRYPNRWTVDMDLFLTAIEELSAERPGYYFDFICVNNYPGDTRHEGIATMDNFRYLESLSTGTGLPILISEFGVHGRDCGFPTGNDVNPDIGWFWRQVNTQADRGRTYDKMVRQWASSPYIIGAQWFQWHDLIQAPAGGLGYPVPWDSQYYRGRNCGVIDFHNNFYTGLTNQMAITNAAIAAAYDTQTRAGHCWALME